MALSSALTAVPAPPLATFLDQHDIKWQPTRIVIDDRGKKSPAHVNGTLAKSSDYTTSGELDDMELMRRKNMYTDSTHLAIDTRDIAQITQIGTRRRSPLMLACAMGLAGIVADFVAAGANVGFSDDLGCTALHLATLCEQPGACACVRALLSARDVAADARDTRLRTPLMNAAGKGNSDSIAALLDAKADVNLVDDRQATPLHLAAAEGHVKCVEILLRAPGIEVNTRDANGCAPLHLAAAAPRACIKALLSSAREVAVDPRDMHLRTCQVAGDNSYIRPE